MNPGLFRFFKLAASVHEKLDTHFSTISDGKKWATFRRELKSKGFLKAVEDDDRSDDKLKQYSKMVHLHKTGKGPTFPVKSDDSGKTYVVKYHPDLQRFSCPCPDWTIKHTIDGGDCKHIRKLKSQASMVKEAGFALRELMGAGRLGAQLYRTDKHDTQAWNAGQVNKIHQNVAQQRRLRARG